MRPGGGGGGGGCGYVESTGSFSWLAGRKASK